MKTLSEGGYTILKHGEGSLKAWKAAGFETAAAILQRVGKKKQ